MTHWHRFTQMVHLTALGLWLGTVVMAGAAAAVIFPTMKQLDPSLPGFTGFEGEHWRLAAGQVAARVFFIADVVQFPTALLAAVTMGLLLFVFGLPRRALSTVLRVLGLAVGLAAFASLLLIVNQSMNTALRAYWAAARAGDTETALRHQAAFSELHPAASALMATTAIAVLVALGAGAWAAGASGDVDGAAGVGRGNGRPVLEPPALLKGR